MNSFVVNEKLEATIAVNVTVTADALGVELEDGRTLTVPLLWYPRLWYATPEERSGWRFIARGRGIHWEAIDEDICVGHLLAGFRSGESQTSLNKWLDARQSKSTVEKKTAAARKKKPTVRQKRAS